MKLANLALFSLLSSALAVPVKRALPRLGGINLAGCEFGMNVWGWTGTPYCPGTSQIDHFVGQGANVVRIPFGWQYMVTDQSSSKLVDAYFAQYDKLVQATTAKGAFAILDLHNYGRWNSAVVGVDGPSNADFARLWGLLAAKYANNPLVMFGLMNEPHDQDIGKFAVSCQAAVNAIRAAGAKFQAIILPGNSWDNAGVWASGANAVMLEVNDPASSDKSALLLDVHKYIDADGSGTSTTCTNNGLDLLTPLVKYLHTTGRRAILTEIGAASSDSCLNYFPQMMQYIVDNADVFVGFAIWSAGSFQPYPGYELSIVPNADGSDQPIWIRGVKPFLPGRTPPAPSSTSVRPSSTAASSTASSTKTSAAVTSSVPKPSSSVVPRPSSSVVPKPSSSVVPKPSSSVAPSPASSAAPSRSSSAVATQSSTAASTSTVQSSAAVTSKPTPPATSTAITSTAAPTTTTSSPVTPPAAGNLQPFTGALGGYPAPAVTQSGGFWYIGTQRYNFLIDALNQSCYKQLDVCQLNANRGGNVAPLTVSACHDTQLQACLATAAAAGQS